METRTVEFFEKKVEQIDVKIEKCFKAFEEGSEHLHHYKLIADGVETETTYISVSSMVSNINRLEELRAFYLERLYCLKGIKSKYIDLPEFPIDEPTKQ